MSMEVSSRWSVRPSMITSSMASVRKSVLSLRVFKRVSKMLLPVIVIVDQTPVIQVIN